MSRQIPAFDPRDPWPEGNELLIVGPPGTGKTRCLLDDYLLPALAADQSVLAISYTRAAAGEIRGRLARNLGGSERGYRSIATTIHSESLRLIDPDRKRYKIGVDAPPEPDDEDEDPIDEGSRQFESALRWIGIEHQTAITSWHACRLKFPNTRSQSVIDRLSAMAEINPIAFAPKVEAYEREKYDDGGLRTRIDFVDMLELALDVEPRPVQLLLVDECQDLLNLQWEVVNRWRAVAGRTLLVADPDQAIYGWAGADGKVLTSWIRSGRPTRRLRRSWRVPRATHAWARSVIQSVEDRVDAPYDPCDRAGQVIEIDAGMAWHRANDDAAAGRDVMILCRTCKGCQSISQSLVTHTIPHSCERGGSALAAKKSLRIVSAVAAIGEGEPVHKDELLDLIRALRWHGCRWRSPTAKRSKKATVKAIQESEQNRFSAQAIEAISGLNTATIAAAWETDRIEWSRLLLASVSSAAARTIAEWRQTYGASFVDRARRLVVTTLHAAKGREADTVILDGRKRGKAQLCDEEYRLLYVAITRAKDALLVIRGDWLSMFGPVAWPRAGEVGGNGMDASELRRKLTDAGLRLSIEGDRLKVTPKDRLTDSLVAEIKVHRDELYAACWQETAAELFGSMTHRIDGILAGAEIEDEVAQEHESRIDRAWRQMDRRALEEAMEGYVRAAREAVS